MRVSIGASGISGTHTADREVFTTGVIVSLGWKVDTPVDQASNLNLVLEIPLVGAMVTGVLGATNCVAGATPVVAPTME